jgi:hypothetical protein
MELTLLLCHFMVCTVQACHTAASDAATQSEHARTAAETAAAAVLSAQKSVLDAAVSAEAQAQASKAGECFEPGQRFCQHAQELAMDCAEIPTSRNTDSTPPLY